MGEDHCLLRSLRKWYTVVSEDATLVGFSCIMAFGPNMRRSGLLVSTAVAGALGLFFTQRAWTKAAFAVVLGISLIGLLLHHGTLLINWLPDSWPRRRSSDRPRKSLKSLKSQD